MKGLLIGKFLKPFGIKGYLKTEFYVDSLEDLEDFSAFYIRDRLSPGGWKRFEFEDIEVQGERIVCRISLCGDRSSAEQFHNIEIYVDEAELPESSEDEFYIKDLIGCNVVFENNSLGQVYHIAEVAERSLLLIRRSTQGELALPFEDRYLKEVDISGKTIVYRDIEDLL